MLLLADPELGAVPVAAVRLAARLVGRGGTLQLLVPIHLPLTVPLDAPAVEGTERAAALCDQIERLAGAGGVAVRSHLRRGRTVRVMLQEAARLVEADLVVVPFAPGQGTAWRDLPEEIAPAQAVLVPTR